MLFAFSSCKSKLQNEFLEKAKKGDTLILSAFFSECGEWGGHHEFIYIFKESNQNFKAKFIKDTVSCKGDPNHTRSINKIIKRELKNEEIDLIDEYVKAAIKNSTEAKRTIYHSADSYKISNSDSTVRVLDGNSTWNGFRKLTKQLHFE